ncbi:MULTISPECIES: hypothetical protein [unclassified Sphingomonas]|uniref:hypothetical protein n=1 Tax=unclassified Sphingomonas TaxID=196159 RepID=UPI000833A693|nr:MULTISPECIES: hypothetical protein [unclassified Sphingomonas]
MKADDPFAVVRSAHRSARGLQLTLDASHSADLIMRLADHEIILDRTADSVAVLLLIISPPAEVVISSFQRNDIRHSLIGC